MDANPGATSERAGTRSSSRALLRQRYRAWHGAGVTVSPSPASRRSRACHAPSWPVVECHSDSPGHAARAAGSDAGALQTWFGPPGRPKPGVSRGTD